MNTQKYLLLCLLIAMVALPSCTRGSPDNSTQTTKMVIAVSILPQQYFLERIGGSRVSALVLVGPGQDPHSYDPTPRQMVSLSKAKAWVLSATDFEKGLRPKIAAQYPDLLIIEGTKGVTFRHLEAHGHESEDAAENEPEGIDGTIDRHTWLGSGPAKIMAAHITDLLVRLDPAGKTVYESNYRGLLTDIESVYSNLKKELAPLAGTTVLVFHPAFGYFLDEFGIQQEAVETGGKEPTAKALSVLIETARKDKPPAIFVQTQFPVSAAKTVADSVGAEVVMLDPLAPDWLENISAMGNALKKALLRTPR